MDYKKIKKDNYNIHIIKDKRFHTVFLRAFFTENVTFEKITYRNFLINILSYATKKYNSRSQLLRKCQDVYAMYPVVSTCRYGNLLATKFTLSTINSMYIDNNYIKETILLLKEILLNPLVENNGFSKKYFDVVKNEQFNEVKTIKEEPRLYANIKLLDLLEPDKEKKYTLSGYSDYKVINNMDEKKLYKSYLEMIENSRIDIFISGNITNDDEIVNTIIENFNFPKCNPKLLSPYIYHRNKNTKLKCVKETKSYNQSKLSVGIKAYNMNNFEVKYVFSILSIMLGGQTDSILMQEVREDKSLAYYIGCYHNKLDGIIVINSGINKDNYEKVIELIKNTLYKISIGKFKMSYLKKSILEYVNEIESLKDNNNSLIEYKYGQELFGSDDIEKRVENIKKVTKYDIIKLVKKLQINAIFYLEGEL